MTSFSNARTVVVIIDHVQILGKGLDIAIEVNTEKCIDIDLILMIFPHMSFHFKLVPFQYLG